MGGRSQNSRTVAVPVEHIAHALLILRNHRVILDQNLAASYGVTTKRHNEQVRRNRERFPEDCMFQLTAEELAALRSQFATSKAPAPQAVVGGAIFPMPSPSMELSASSMSPPSPRRRPIGFTANLEEKA